MRVEYGTGEAGDGRVGGVGDRGQVEDGGREGLGVGE